MIQCAMPGNCTRTDVRLSTADPLLPAGLGAPVAVSRRVAGIVMRLRRALWRRYLALRRDAQLQRAAGGALGRRPADRAGALLDLYAAKARGEQSLRGNVAPAWTGRGHQQLGLVVVRKLHAEAAGVI